MKSSRLPPTWMSTACRSLSRSTITRGAVLLGALWLALACDEKKEASVSEVESESSKKEAPEPDKKPTSDADIDAQLDQALKPVRAPVEIKPKEQANFEILEAGAEPRKKLRYHFKQGRKKTFQMSMAIVPKMTVNGSPMPGSPPMQFDISGTSTTRAVKDDGVAIRDTVFNEFKPAMTGVPPQVMQQLTAQMDMFSGMAMAETITPQGRVLEVDLKADSAQPQAQALLRNLQDGLSNAFLPLPEDPVGAGAKWQGTTVVDTGGIALNQTSTFELVKLVGEQATILVTFEQSADPQRVQDPRLPSGATAELEKMDGKGDGKLSVNLATLDTESEVEMNMEVKTKITGQAPPAPGSTTPGAAQSRTVVSTTQMKMKMKLSE